MKKFMSLLAVLMFTVSAFSQKVLSSDAAHSRIQFTVVHLGINDITGNFKTAEMTINADEKSFVKSKISFKADVASISTDVDQRDTHLKGADFFDAEKYPEMSFTSTAILAGKSKNTYTLRGNLTMHGVTRPVAVTLVYRGSTVNPMSKKTTYSYQVSGTVKRSAFGIGPKYPEAMVSDLVRIKGDFELLEK